MSTVQILAQMIHLIMDSRDDCMYCADFLECQECSVCIRTYDPDCGLHYCDNGDNIDTDTSGSGDDDRDVVEVTTQEVMIDDSGKVLSETPSPTRSAVDDTPEPKIETYGYRQNMYISLMIVTIATLYYCIANLYNVLNENSTDIALVLFHLNFGHNSSNDENNNNNNFAPMVSLLTDLSGVNRNSSNSDDNDTNDNNDDDNTAMLIVLFSLIQHIECIEFFLVRRGQIRYQTYEMGESSVCHDSSIRGSSCISRNKSNTHKMNNKNRSKYHSIDVDNSSDENHHDRNSNNNNRSSYKIMNHQPSLPIKFNKHMSFSRDDSINDQLIDDTKKSHKKSKNTHKKRSRKSKHGDKKFSNQIALQTRKDTDKEKDRYGHKNRGKDKEEIRSSLTLRSESISISDDDEPTIVSDNSEQHGKMRSVGDNLSYGSLINTSDNSNKNNDNKNRSGNDLWMNGNNERFKKRRSTRNKNNKNNRMILEGDSINRIDGLNSSPWDTQHTLQSLSHCAIPDHEFTEKEAKNINGVAVHHRVEFNKHIENTDKTFIVLIHGFGDGIFSWKRCWNNLSKLSRGLSAFDRPGFGLTGFNICREMCEHQTNDFMCIFAKSDKSYCNSNNDGNNNSRNNNNNRFGSVDDNDNDETLDDHCHLIKMYHQEVPKRLIVFGCMAF